MEEKEEEGDCFTAAVLHPLGFCSRLKSKNCGLSKCVLGSLCEFRTE